MNFHEPKLQLYIVRIILLIPICASQAFLCLLFPQNALWFDVVKDGYEAYVLYIFLQLLIQYIGGENVIVSHLETKQRMKHPWPYTNYLRPDLLNRNFFWNVKRGILQFVFVKPFTSVAAILLSSQNQYDEGILNLKSGYLYCSIITNISVSIALYSLVLFYGATKEKLISYNPFWKFIMVKSILFFSYWQSFIIFVLHKFDVFGDHRNPKILEKAIFYQDYIVLFEMVIAGICFNYVFSYEDFYDLAKPAKPVFENLGKVLNMKDLLDDAKSTFVDDQEDYDTPLKDLSYYIESQDEVKDNEIGKALIDKDQTYESYFSISSQN